MPRYYRRRYYRGYSKKLRYASETMTQTAQIETGATPAQNITANGNYGVFPPLQIITPAVTQGIRKVKNFTLSIAPTLIDPANGNAQVYIPVRYVLIYVPEGTNPNQIQIGAGVNSLYEPNQNVIIQGSFLTGTPYRTSTRLARNLNSGDSIYLLMAASNTAAWGTQKATFGINLNYAIAYA